MFCECVWWGCARIPVALRARGWGLLATAPKARAHPHSPLPQQYAIIIIRMSGGRAARRDDRGG